MPVTKLCLEPTGSAPCVGRAEARPSSWRSGLGRSVPLLLALMTFETASAFAQSLAEKYSGKQITAVQVFVEREPSSDPTLTELIETRPGQALSMASVRETITHLFSLGRFQDIQVEAYDAPAGGVELHYNVIPVHAVERVEFGGDLGLSSGLVKETVEERFGRTPQLGRSADVVRLLERLYQDQGYFRASIRPSSEQFENPHRTVLTFEITAGPRARIDEIRVVGDPLTSQEDLLRRLRLATGQYYDRVGLEARLAEFSGRLRDRGHLQATVGHRLEVSENGALATLVVDVQPGPVVSVTFLGDPLPRTRQDELVPFEREGSLDEDLVEDSVQRIREYLRQEGYWKADVTVEQVATPDTLTVAFTVRKGPLYRIGPDGVRITGSSAVPIDQLRPLLTLAPGDPYVASQLDAAARAVLDLYRTRGFAWADVKTAEEEVAPVGTGAAFVRPTIAIAEGPRAVIGQVRITGVQALSEAEILRVVKLQPGQPYYEPNVRADRDAVELEYRNLGYTLVEVTVAPAVSEERARVDLTYSVTEGPQTLVDHVIIVGNTRTSEEVIRREVVLEPGAPLGLRDILESRRRLSQLGLFRRIDIRELEHGPPTRRDLLITVEEAAATVVGYGGGLEVTRRLRASGPGGEAAERMELAPRGFFEIGRRNLGGKNRSINLFTRVSIRPKDAPDNPEEDGRGFGFSEYRVVGTYREPRAFNWNADLLLTGAVEQGVRSAFNFARKGVTAELIRRLTPATRATVRYTFGTTRTFDERLSEEEQAVIDKLFPQVRLSGFSAAIFRDTRDDLVEPTSGTALGAEGTLAARALGGQVGFVKTYLQGMWYKRVPGTSRIIFATRASLGLADGFSREAVTTDPDELPIEDLPASERFFAGGDTTIRGYALDTVGADETISPRGFPRGGNAVLILNGELRLPVWKDIGAAVFVDGGNVFERVTDFTLEDLRGSTGFGLRYRSPIGPIRVDMGFKMDRRVYGGRLEPRSVIHFSIGQAF
jgi:outer membrane protein assembly factor BamA